VVLLVDQIPLIANEKCWNLHPAYGSQMIAAGCVGVFQTSHPWSKYSVIESPNLWANGTQMVQVLVVYSKGAPEMNIHDCSLNSHNQPGLTPSQHHWTCIYSLSSHFHALFPYAHYVLFQSSICMTNFEVQILEIRLKCIQVWSSLIRSHITLWYTGFWLVQ
jgi:hypothetical protein